MARRIRTIKPEILEDPRSSCLSSDSWRLWVSSWLIADDYGNCRANPNRLHGEVFWNCKKAVDVGRCIKELHEVGLITTYVVKGEEYFSITNWSKHQRIDNASKRLIYPGPEKGLAATRGDSQTLAEILGSERDREEDKERELEEEKESLPGGLAEEVLCVLNESRARAIPGARKLSALEANLKHISARLSAGHAKEDLLHVIAVCEAETKAGGDPRWFDAVTPFRPDNFAKRLAMSVETVSRPAGVKVSYQAPSLPNFKEGMQDLTSTFGSNK